MVPLNAKPGTCTHRLLNFCVSLVVFSKKKYPKMTFDTCSTFQCYNMQSSLVQIDSMRKEACLIPCTKLLFIRARLFLCKRTCLITTPKGGYNLKKLTEEGSRQLQTVMFYVVIDYRPCKCTFKSSIY